MNSENLTKFKIHLQTRISLYMKTCKSSILQNFHMNEYEEIMPFNEDEIRMVINSTVNKFIQEYNGLDSTGDVLFALVLYAQQTLGEAPHLEAEAATKAGIVDYINYVASMVGVDYGLSTGASIRCSACDRRKTIGNG